MAVSVRAFDDSPKFWLITGFVDLCWTVGEAFYMKEGEVSFHIAPPPWIATGCDLSRGKPAGKIVDFYLTGGPKEEVSIR